ncbi:effector-associated constant component EACC1 [Thermomonospora umbrina]|uniref:Uncharacterized protein n=1 Tax=Thermomonospora umbrina TaxID=111806 RepID=A0A3D9STA6_9ACTN|nr:hypothetical protein [Thermomonospora umbrina]REE99172.1 hypothetical protein DFJ69_4679 [Thermomonospora umbrina]
MELTITAADTGDDRDLISLHHWLTRDAAVARHGRPELVALPHDAGELGGAFDVISMALADAAAIAGVGSLWVAVKTWRSTRARPPALRIEYDGVTVIVEEGSEVEIQPLLDALRHTSPPDDA